MERPGLSDLLDLRLRTDRIGGEPRELVAAADAEAREALAERLDVLAVEALDARLVLARFRGGIRVTGRVCARIAQACVVSFVPVFQDIDEPVDRVFLPASQRPREPDPGSEVFVDLEGEDPPDYIDGPEIDLSELVVETVSLAIDPYPRAPDAELSELGAGDADEEAGPFAGLKALKGKEPGAGG